MRDLVLYHDDNGSFIDYTLEARDFLRDEFTVDFTNGEDHIYLGLYKPFNMVFLELKTGLLADSNLTAEYYDGATWQSLNIIDDSKGMQRDGFISWFKPLDWAETSINIDSKYYIRFNMNTDTPEIQGFNVVFADDNDLRQEVRCIDDYLQGNDSSFIAYHVSARNDIIQTMRNGGNSTKQENKINHENLTKWDLLDLGEVRQAAKYLALHKIFFDVSENPDDKQYQRAIDYNQKYGEAFKLFRLSIDKNDDGIADDEEKTEVRRMRVLKR